MKIKKFAVMALTTVMLAMSLVGCGGKKGECELCGEEKTLTKYTFEGESAWLCKDCKKLMKSFEAFF